MPDVSPYEVCAALERELPRVLDAAAAKLVLPDLQQFVAAYLRWRAYTKRTNASKPKFAAEDRRLAQVARQARAVAAALRELLRGYPGADLRPFANTAAHRRSAFLIKALYDRNIVPAHAMEAFDLTADALEQHVRLMAGPSHRRQDYPRHMLHRSVAVALRRAGIEVTTAAGGTFERTLVTVYEVVGLNAPTDWNRILRTASRELRTLKTVDADVEMWCRFDQPVQKSGSQTH